MEDDDKKEMLLGDQLAIEIMKILMSNEKAFCDYSTYDHYSKEKYDSIEERNKAQNFRAKFLAETSYRIARAMRKARLKAFD